MQTDRVWQAYDCFAVGLAQTSAFPGAQLSRGLLVMGRAGSRCLPPG